MVTLPDCEGPFEPLLRIIEDNMAPEEDRVDAYLRITERLREEEGVFVKEVLCSLLRIITVLKRDIHSDKLDLCQASLQTLGHCLYQEQLASSIYVQDGQGLIEGLLKRIKDSGDKGVCTRALWCLAKQNLDSTIISSKLEPILSSLELALQKNLQSVTVDHEVLCVIERLLEQLPRCEMIKSVDCWAKILFPLLVSSASKVRERCLLVLSAGLEHMIVAKEKVATILLPLLKQTLFDEFSQLCSDKKELFVLKAWCCIVPLLGENLHKGGNLINNLLKLVEQGFRVPQAEVQVMAFSAWTILIDNFALSPDILCTPKRIKLIMTPFLNLAVKERNEAVEAVRLMTWWHFICLLEPRVLEHFDQVCIPLLHFIFGTSIDQVNTLKTKEGFGDLRCPPTPTNVKLLTDMMAEPPKSNVRRSLREIGTSKTPTVQNASFAKTAKQKLVAQGCEILVELLRMDNEIVNHQFCTVERLRTSIFKKPEEFKKYSGLLINCTREGFKTLGKELSETLAANIWNLVLKRAGELLEKGPSSDYSEVFLPLLAAMQDFVENDVLQPSVTVKMLEELSHLPDVVLSHHMAWLHSKDNPQGSPALLLIQLLFEPTLLTEVWNCERFHVSFEHFVNCGLMTSSGQLFYMKKILTLLEKAARIVSNKDALWRLWSCVVDHLNEHILKTNDVNQGDALEHDFTTLYLAVTFPFKHLLDASLPQGTSRAVSKTLADLYRSFARAAALVSTAEANICNDELCAKILAIEGDWKCKDVTFTDALVSLAGVMIDCLDFSSPGFFAMATVAAGKSPNTTPTRFNKRPSRPMGNLTGIVLLVSRLLSACERVDSCQNSTQSLGILTATLTNLIDKLSYLFLHVNGQVTIAAILKTLSPSLAPFVKNSHTSVKNRKNTLDKRLFTARLIQKVEKLWSDLLTCVQSRHGGPYGSDLLSVLSPLLEVTLAHPKRNFKNQAVIFWNATFAHAQWLDYPESLRPVLQAIKEKMSLTLPGWQNIKVAARDTEEENETEDMTQTADLLKPLPYGVLASPQRRGNHQSFPEGSPKPLKGSFLHKAASTEKAVENLSPKKVVRSPILGRPRNSPASMHVRRKLPLSKYDDDDQEYVVIAPSPKKKRLLTEHQKEVMRSRSAVPALYNALDQSQDGTQFSQFSGTSQALVTSDPSPEVEKEFNLEPIVEEVVSADDEDCKEMGDNLPKTSLDGNKLDGGDQQLKNVEMQKENKEEVDRIDENDQEVEELMEVNMEQTEDKLPEEKEALGKQNSGDDVACSTDIQRLSDSVDEDSSVTSPDVIPSSQASSYESPFQSLRRMSIPLKSILTPSGTSVANAEKSENNEVGECDTTEKSEIKAPVTGCNEIEKTETLSPSKSDRRSADKPKVSPVAGRTRRKLQQKTVTDKTPDKRTLEKRAGKVTGKLSDEDALETEKSDAQSRTEKAIVPPAVAARDMTSSPVPSPLKKFVRPLAAGGSPSRAGLLGRSSPGVSPTTGILKRWLGAKQAADSPSPPGKVRRVSFALPVKDISDSDEFQEKSANTNSSSSLQRGTSSSLFTAVKQRRSVPVSNEQCSNDLTECIYPELVGCSLPVEQILPSIVSLSWSRGLGHLVRAQNIHTIGNLSALQEDQVNNLPIKSPKVMTLKNALKKFHQSQRGRNLKYLATKVLTGVPIKDSEERKVRPLQNVDAVAKEQNNVEAARDCQAEEKPGQNVALVNESDSSDEPSNVAVDKSETTAVLAECIDSAVETDDRRDVDLELVNSLTPKHSGHDLESVEVAAEMTTPQRETFALPTKLFSQEKSLDTCANTETENMNEDETLNKANNVEKDLEVEVLTNKASDLVTDIKLRVSEACKERNSEPSGCDKNATEDGGSDKETFCNCLRLLKNLSSHDVLQLLSSEEIFEAHQNLSEVMSLVVQALRSRVQSPRSKRTSAEQ